MLCIGHRGAMGYAPENTLLAMRTALEMGVDWIELDVHLVAGELIVIHDDTLERTTNGEGHVSAHSLAYLRGLDAGQGEQIPLLQEVFALVDRRAGINIELKGAETAVPTVTFIEQQLKQGWPLDQILVSSFHHDMLRQVRALNPAIRLGMLTPFVPDDLAAPAQKMGAFAINPWIMTVTEELVQDAHQRGIKVFVWTVNEPDDIARMRAWDVDGIFTNYPDRCRA